LKAIISTTLTLLLGAVAHAQVIHKSVMPDGKVIYSEKPVPGAARIETIEPPPAKTGMSALTPEEKARADQFAKDRAAAASAAAKKGSEIEEAQRQLKQAEAARETGKEPLPGERVGTVGGTTRLSDAYYLRQKTLEDAVLAARKRLEQLQSVR
jgi:hypothetical protein